MTKLTREMFEETVETYLEKVFDEMLEKYDDILVGNAYAEYSEMKRDFIEETKINGSSDYELFESTEEVEEWLDECFGEDEKEDLLRTVKERELEKLEALEGTEHYLSELAEEINEKFEDQEMLQNHETQLEDKTIHFSTRLDQDTAAYTDIRFEVIEESGEESLIKITEVYTDIR